MLPFTIYQGLTIETVSCKSFVSKLLFRQTPCLMGSKERTSGWHGIVMCAIGRGFFLFLSLSRLSLPCGIGHLVTNSNVYWRYRTVKNYCLVNTRIGRFFVQSCYPLSYQTWSFHENSELPRKLQVQVVNSRQGLIRKKPVLE